MPNRILREGILTSRRVDRLSLDAEVFFRRLLSVLDDYARFSADPQLLRAACYPLRLDSVIDAGISQCLAECRAQDLLVTYEIDGEPYLEVRRFRQQKRAARSKYPCPPTAAQHVIGTGDAPAQHVRPYSESESESESKASQVGSRPPDPPDAHEEGSPRRVDETVPGAEADDFADFWYRYPARAAEAAARTEWHRLRREDRTAALHAVKLYAEAWREAPESRRRFIPNAATWLRGRRWTENREEWERQVAGSPKQWLAGTHLPARRVDAGGGTSGSLPVLPATPEGPENVLPAVLEEARPEVDERDFNVWLRPLRQAGAAAEVLVIAAPSLVGAEYVRAEFLPTIAAAAVRQGIAVPLQVLPEDRPEAM